MKAVRVISSLLLALFVIASSQAETDAADPLAAVASLFAGEHQAQEHQHRRPATTPLALPELESAALANNLELKTAMRRIAVAETRVRSAGSLEDPSFMYRGWGTPLVRPWDLNQTQHMFMFSQALPGRGKRALRAQVASQDVEVLQAELEAKKREVVSQVRKSFYELLLNQDELSVHDQQVELTRQALESARVKYVVGRVPQQDVLKAQIALTKLADHLVMLSEQGQFARARLNTLLGRDPATPLEVAGQYKAVQKLPGLLDLEKLALESRPELIAASAAIRQGETRTKLAQKAFSPDYSLSAGYMLMPDGAQYRNTYMAELEVTLPWLNRGRHNAEIAEAQADVAVERAEYEARRALVFQEIQEALIRAQSAKRLSDLYRDTLRPQARAALTATRAAYQTDRTDFLNLLDSQNTTLDVELSYYRTHSELETRLADLERAVGAPLPRDGPNSASVPGDASTQTSLEVR